MSESHDALLVVDREGVIASITGATAEFLGSTPPAALVGRPMDVLIPVEYRERHWAGFRAAMASGSAEAEGVPINLPVLSADGSVKHLATRFTLIRDVQGRAHGAAAVLAEPDPGDPPLYDL